ncbi:MAG: hypothetical protein Q9191_003954 [Dirinaria sp. TL-2023a]
MDASTIAAVAALAVAFVALLVAFAQAVQQYLVSGQLIRICDSVVYGKMPGQGHRVWQTVQNASGDSLRYEMVEGDADRCPTDLPVVPMQLSMKDVVALALMAGMQCTDVSFESQSLSMQGSAGTITSSRHPVLGALIHFAPKQPFETHGVRTDNGNLHRDWIVRLSDTITVAGYRYDRRGRRHFEEDEGSWIRSSSDKSIVQIVGAETKPAHSPYYEIRRRRWISKQQSDDSPDEHLTAGQDLAIGSNYTENKQHSFNDDLRRSQDGEWSLATRDLQSQESKSHHDQQKSEIPCAQPSRGEVFPQPASYLRRKFRMLIKFLGSGSSNSVLPISEPRDDDVRVSTSYLAQAQNNSPPATAKVENAGAKSTIRMRNNTQYHLDKQDLGDYISEKRRLENSQHGSDMIPKPGSSQLLLTSKDHHNDPDPNLSAIRNSLAPHQGNSSESLRTQYVVDKWQEIFKRRQKERSRRRSANVMLKQGLAELAVKIILPVASVKKVNHLVLIIPKPSALVTGTVETVHMALALQLLHKMKVHTSGEVVDATLVSQGGGSIFALLMVHLSTVMHQYQVRPGEQLPHTTTDQSPITSDDEIQRKRLESPTSNSHKAAPSKGVLREPRERFPEDPNFTREGVAPARLAHGERSIPAEARYTKIDRRLVSPAALDMGDERYEATPDHVIVLRVLTKEEIQVYAMETSQIRDRKRAISRRHTREPSSSPTSTELDVPEVSSDDSGDSAASFERIPLSPAVSEGAKSNSIVRHLEETTDEPNSPRSTETDDQNIEQTTDVRSDSVRRNENGAPHSKRSSVGASSLAAAEDMSQHNSQSHAFTHELGRMYWQRKRSSGSTASTRRKVDRQSLHRDKLAIHHQPLDEAPQPLTYEEELILIKCENILKHTRSSTEECKDVSVTLKFFLDNQAQLDTRAQDALEHVRILNNLLKDLLLIIEPIQYEKKTATFVLSELDILMRSTRTPLSMLKEDFALFDITPLPLEARRREWSKLMLAFQEENPFSLPEHLELSCRYGSEILANVKAGILSSSESDLLKSRICRLNGFVQESSSSYTLDSKEPISKSAAHHRRRVAASRHSSPGILPAAVTRHNQASNRDTTASDDTDSEGLSDNDERSSLASTLAESKSTPTGEVNWLWICQADIIPGFWATPWTHLFSDAVCLGAMSVVLKVLETFTTKANMKYVESQPRYRRWHGDGKSTYPSYAHNSRGGIVVSGVYEPVRFSAFEHPIAAIELLHSYDHQVSRSPFLTTESVVDSIGELMGLDSWLSMAGRLPEIELGPSDLLRTLPTLIQQLMTDFDLEFSSLDRTSKDGGLRIIQTIAAGLLQTFTEQNLSEAEQLFTSIALLRAAKVGLCIARGPDTSKLRDVLRHDVQVYLA